MEYVSRFGKYLVVCDHLRSLTFHSRLRTDVNAVPRPPVRPLTFDAHKIYVACIRPFGLPAGAASGEGGNASGVARGAPGTTRLLPPEMVDLCPALVLLDTNLPGEDTATVLQRIRGDAFQGQPRCLALVDTRRQQRDAMAAGADVALLKGYPTTKLFEVIQTLTVGRETRGELAK